MRLARTTFQGAQIMKTYIKLSCLTALVVAALILGIGLPAYAADPSPLTVVPTIPPQPDARLVPLFIGHEASPKPITSRPIPQNPHMSQGSWGVSHADTYMSDTYITGGPLGKAPMTVLSHALGSYKGSEY